MGCSSNYIYIGRNIQRTRFIPNIEIKSDGNQTYKNEDSMNWVHMGINKTFVDYEMLYQLYICLSPSSRWSICCNN